MPVCQEQVHLATIQIMDLFAHGRQEQIEREAPLAYRMRPRTLDEFAGQEHIVGPGRLLRRAIQADQLTSLIFYGPPGTGKTTLAMIIANTTESYFITLNAVLAGVAQIRAAIKEAEERRNLYGQRTTLFVDEVHRWNKAQQDALLPHVEKGTIIMIGATTENPYFEVNKALVSRSRIFQLKPLSEEALYLIAHQALNDPDRGYGHMHVTVADAALAHLVDVANGDARGVLNALELAIETTPPDEKGELLIDLSVAEESIQRRAVLYDKEGDVHYDTISAFIKSLRGSDPDATLYWMAKMIYAGEDPRFIFRRMGILAGEDVGMADPNAVTVVASCWELFERIGMPEGRFPLAVAAIYLATAPKSNSSLAFFDALAAVEREQEADVPNHLRDANRDQEGFGHGQGYLYPHAYRDHWVAQQYLPDTMQGKVFYEPSEQGYERKIHQEVARRREAQLAAMVEDDRAVPEVLTTGPTNRSQDAWLQRAIANTGRHLGQVRNRVFELAQIQRHYLILDLNAGSGLLTWEAVRRAPEGGIWALAADQQSGDALRQMAERMPDLERPVIMIGEMVDFAELFKLRAEEDVQFNRILGRNAFNHNVARVDQMLELAHKLLSGGLLCLAQVVPQNGQRLYDLVDWGDLPAQLHDQVRDAEESIYQDPDDPLVNWQRMDLEAQLKEAGFEDIRLTVEIVSEQRHISQEQLDRWFAAVPGGRQSYGERLARILPDDQLLQVERLYRRQLMGKLVTWRSTQIYVAAGLRKAT